MVELTTEGRPYGLPPQSVPQIRAEAERNFEQEDKILDRAHLHNWQPWYNLDMDHPRKWDGAPGRSDLKKYKIGDIAYRAARYRNDPGLMKLMKYFKDPDLEFPGFALECTGIAKRKRFSEITSCKCIIMIDFEPIEIQCSCSNDAVLECIKGCGYEITPEDPYDFKVEYGTWEPRCTYGTYKCKRRPDFGTFNKQEAYNKWAEEKQMKDGILPSPKLDMPFAPISEPGQYLQELMKRHENPVSTTNKFSVVSNPISGKTPMQEISIASTKAEIEDLGEIVD